jgi:hypothetical protein
MPSIYLNGRKYSGSGTQGENGKNVVVAKIEPIIGGNRVTFSYFDDKNVQKTEAIEVMNGANGISIANARIDNGNHLILGLSDGNQIDAGIITLDPNNINLTNYYTSQQIDLKLDDLRLELDTLIPQKIHEEMNNLSITEIDAMF